MAASPPNRFDGPFQGDLDPFKICRRCSMPYERTHRAHDPEPVQFGRPEVLPDQTQMCYCPSRRYHEPTWPGSDFNERLHLCECCFVPLGSGSKYSVWFCSPCKKEVAGFNGLFGRGVIRIGRHSLHTSVGPPAEKWRAVLRADQAASGFPEIRLIPGERLSGLERGEPAAVEAVEEFCAGLQAMVGSINGLHDWSKTHRLGLLDRWFPGSGDPTLPEFLDRLERARAEDPELQIDVWRERFFRDLAP